ncbi:sugar-binding transcriptional regulator [Trueperella abortisuis]|uniref:sugar-binding transcriptional regulator n=1 Tax=Trueperella abortisuis TaxID=445930 RepID=UPI00289349AC|nr:sugar-binding transcriptional regulator [Trueperella abortisuis]
MKPPSEHRREQILRATKLYYLNSLSTTQIAQQLGCSRWTVRRLLQEAKQEGYISIEIVDPYARVTELETALTERFALSKALVARTRLEPEDTILAVAQQAADYLAEIRPMPQLVGVSWGRTISRVASQLSQGWSVDPLIVQLNGGVADLSSGRSVQNTVLKFAQSSNGKAKGLPCPAIVSSSSLAAGLTADPVISDLLELGKQVDVAVYSLGSLQFESVLVESGCVTRQEVSQLRAQGGVGDILGHFISGAGQIVSADLEARTIGMSLTELKKIKHSIAVSTGENKASITRAALKGGFLTTLVTDELTAKEVLSER